MLGPPCFSRDIGPHRFAKRRPRSPSAPIIERCHVPFGSDVAGFYVAHGYAGLTDRMTGAKPQLAVTMSN
jgi:hypothetical protein